MIKAENLSKRYGEIHAAASITFEVNKGEICGLLGQNGAGKTTVMKMITGFIEPTDGIVTVDGLDVTTNRLVVQNKIGYMPENSPIYPDMLVQEYLLMIAKLRNIPEDSQINAVKEAARATGLEKFMTRTIGTLSKGYKQRVGICSAIVHKPQVLILDEPTNGLDPVQIIEIRKLIKNLATKSTVILSTHILQEIEAVCDRVIILIDGKIARDVPLKDFMETRQIQLSVEKNVSYEKLNTLKNQISSISQISHVAGNENDPSNDYIIEWSGDRAPVPQIIKAATDNNWNITSITANPPGLEKAFATLMLEHAQSSIDKSTKEVVA